MKAKENQKELDPITIHASLLADIPMDMIEKAQEIIRKSKMNIDKIVNIDTSKINKKELHPQLKLFEAIQELEKAISKQDAEKAKAMYDSVLKYRMLFSGNTEEIPLALYEIEKWREVYKLTSKTSSKNTHVKEKLVANG